MSSSRAGAASSDRDEPQSLQRCGNRRLASPDVVGCRRRRRGLSHRRSRGSFGACDVWVFDESRLPAASKSCLLDVVECRFTGFVHRNRLCWVLASLDRNIAEPGVSREESLPRACVLEKWVSGRRVRALDGVVTRVGTASHRATIWSSHERPDIPLAEAFVLLGDIDAVAVDTSSEPRLRCVELEHLDGGPLDERVASVSPDSSPASAQPEWMQSVGAVDVDQT